MDIQAQQAPLMPAYVCNWQSPAGAAPEPPRTLYVQSDQPTAFVHLPGSRLPSADDSQFTTAPRSAKATTDPSAWTGAQRGAPVQTSAAAPRVQPEVQRMAEHRVQLLAMKYAMKSSPGAEGEREVLARLQILNAKLAAQAPMVTSTQVTMLEDMARRSDEREARRAARMSARGLG